jgi:hypothetical protein
VRDEQPISAGVIVGSIAAAATTGALIAAGHRAGSAGIPFAAISAALFRRTASGGAVGLVFVGLVLHVLATMIWSAIAVWLVRIVGWRPAAASIAIAAASFLVTWITAWSTGNGVASVLTLGDRVIVGVVFVVALVVGMRLAFSQSQSA